MNWVVKWVLWVSRKTVTFRGKGPAARWRYEGK